MWKNGKKQVLSEGKYTNSVAVSNCGDVHIVVTSTANRPVWWKNGIKQVFESSNVDIQLLSLYQVMMFIFVDILTILDQLFG